MMKNIFNFKLHIYQKIILIFILLLTPIFMISIWINIFGSNYINKGISSSIMSNMELYSKHFEDEFSHIKLQQFQFIDDTDIQRLSYQYEVFNEYEKSYLIYKANERIQTVKNTSDYIKNVGVYIKSINSTISVQKGVEKIPNDEYDLVKNLSSSMESPMIYNTNGSLYLVKSSLMSEPKKYEDNNIISYIEISKDRIRKTLQQLSLAENSGAILLSVNQGFIITSSDDDVITPILESYKRNYIENSSNFIDKLDGKKYLLAYRKLIIKDLVLITYTPESDVMGVLTKFNILFIVLFSVSLIVMIMFSFSVNIMIHKPINKLVKAFKEFELNNLEFSILSKASDEFGYLYSGFNNMIARIKQSIQQNYEQKLSMQQSELKQLQSQINPHFLYNSFFTISRMCKIGEYDKVVTFTQSLASYYQFITRSGSDEVPLIKEYRHAMDYVDIQRIRFANRITVIADELPKEYENLFVPRIIIQPIIENAFEHVFEKNTSNGIIRIEVSQVEDNLCIGIQDNGPTLDDSILRELQRKLSAPWETQEKTGIINVSRRIQLKFGEESGLYVSKSEYGGVKVSIVIKGI